jgi:hypothetical protein
MDNDTLEQVRRLERTAEYYWEHGAFGIAKELYSRAEKLRQQADEKSVSLS